MSDGTTTIAKLFKLRPSKLPGTADVRTTALARGLLVASAEVSWLSFTLNSLELYAHKLHFCQLPTIPVCQQHLLQHPQMAAPRPPSSTTPLDPTPHSQKKAYLLPRTALLYSTRQRKAQLPALLKRTLLDPRLPNPLVPHPTTRAARCRSPYPSADLSRPIQSALLSPRRFSVRAS